MDLLSAVQRKSELDHIIDNASFSRDTLSAGRMSQRNCLGERASEWVDPGEVFALLLRALLLRWPRVQGDALGIILTMKCFMCGAAIYFRILYSNEITGERTSKRERE
jgi:hypothetical protein